MLGEIAAYFVGCPVGGAVLGAFIGLFSASGAVEVQIGSATPECARYTQCGKYAGMCALAEKSEAAYASVNASAIPVLNALSTQTGQQNIADQIAQVQGKCDWTRNNCPHPDPKGKDACDRYNQAWYSIPPIAVKAWVITTVIGAGAGLLLGSVLQIKTCRERNQLRIVQEELL